MVSGLRGNFNNYLTDDFMYTIYTGLEVNFVLDFSSLIQSKPPSAKNICSKSKPKPKPNSKSKSKMKIKIKKSINKK